MLPTRPNSRLWSCHCATSCIAIFAVSCSSGFFAVQAAVDLPLAELPNRTGTGNYVIKEIKIEGNQKTENRSILNTLALKRGDQLNREKIDQRTKALFASGLFTDVKLMRGAGNALIVRVVERPTAQRKSATTFSPRLESNVRLGTNRSTMMLEADLFHREVAHIAV